MRTHVETAEHLEHGGPGRAMAVLARIIDYLFGTLYVLLLVRFVLELLGARADAGFVRLIHQVTAVFYSPFKGIFATTTIHTTIGTVHLVWPLLVAIVAYVVLHALVHGLLRLFTRA